MKSNRIAVPSNGRRITPNPDLSRHRRKGRDGRIVPYVEGDVVPAIGRMNG